MRKIITIILFVLSIPLYSQYLFDFEYTPLDSTELIASYSLHYKHDSLNLHIVRQENMVLFLGKDVSLFTNYNMYILEEDTRYFTHAEQLQAYIDKADLNNLSLRFSYKIFKNYPKGKLTHCEKIIPVWFKYEEYLDIFNWKLTGDTATIAGYKTQKATTKSGGRSWIAWFSPEIPFNDGPYKFNGLPGLIVKVYDTRYHYVFELKSLKKPENKRLIEFVEMDHFKTTKYDFFKAEDAYRNGIIDRAKEAGLNKDMQERAALNWAQRNNPIELKRK